MTRGMTYRERREARAERLRGWADKRETASAATFKSHEVYRGDNAFNTQPGHIPERARVIAQTDRAVASLRKAEGMESRASNIESQLDHAIYSDDPDAAEALKVRIAGLEAERARIKAFNASCRKGQPDRALLDEDQRASLRVSEELCAWQLGKNGAYPPYATANLSGKISANRKRLAGMVA